jgi:hypothetical protein
VGTFFVALASVPCELSEQGTKTTGYAGEINSFSFK